MPGDEARIALLEERCARLERTVGTLARWLVEAQTGFGQHDYEGIERLLAEPIGEGATEPA